MEAVLPTSGDCHRGLLATSEEAPREAPTMRDRLKSVTLTRQWASHTRLGLFRSLQHSHHTLDR